MSLNLSPNVTLRRQHLRPPPHPVSFSDQQRKLLVDILNGNERAGIFCVFQEGQEETVLELAKSLRMTIVKDPYSPAHLVTTDGSLGLLYRQSFLNAVLQSQSHRSRQPCMQVMIFAFQSFCWKIHISLTGVATKLMLESYHIFTSVFVGMLHTLRSFLNLTMSFLSFFFRLLCCVLYTVFCMGIPLLIVLVILALRESYLSSLSEQTSSCICLH